MIPVIAALATGTVTSTVMRIAVATIVGAIIGKKISDHQHKNELENIKAELEALKRSLQKP